MECTRQRLIRAIMLWRTIGQRANARRTPAVYRFALVVVFASILALAPTPRATAFGEEPPARAVDPPASPVVEAAPVEPTSEHIQAWIKQLGDDDFQTRERAQKELVKAGNPAYFALEALPPSDDPEVAQRVLRAKRLLRDSAVDELKRVGASFAKIGGAAHWNVVEINNARLRNVDLAPLVRVTQLEIVSIVNSPITDEAFIYIRALPNLKNLSLRGTGVTDAGLKTIATLSSIESIGLSDTAITNNGLAHLTKLPNLSRIMLTGTAVDGEGLKSLKPLRERIAVLHLGRTRVADDDLLQLNDWVELRSLDLRQTAISGTGLKHISNLPKLASLNLQDIDLDHGCIAHLAKLPELKRLFLKRTGITPECLYLLRGSTSLTTIEVSAETFTEEDAISVEQSLNVRRLGPKLHVFRGSSR